MQASTSAYLDAVKTRRSIYALNKTSPISDDRIEQIFQEIILASPSAFNSQTTRAVLLLNEEHEKFWTMAAKLGEGNGWPEEMLVRLRSRWESFKKAKGSVRVSGLGLIQRSRAYDKPCRFCCSRVMQRSRRIKRVTQPPPSSSLNGRSMLTYVSSLGKMAGLTWT